MFLILRKQRYTKISNVLSVFLLLSFTGNLVLPSVSFAQSALNLPAVGSMISVSEAFTPAMIKGVQIYPDNPLKFNFIIDTGDSKLSGEELKRESNKLIRYFLSALTVPEEELWVNLSPVEKDRIVADGLAQTEMGRDMLAQDYILKQITASLVYPEGELGKKFWNKVRQLAKDKFGTTDVPVDTFNKVWIVPEHAMIYENAGAAFVIENHLKVMLEEDYTALEQTVPGIKLSRDLKQQDASERKGVNSIGSQIVREIVLPELEKDVNAGKNFANLRQIANSVVLAWWYKQNLKQSLLGKVYVDQNKVKGIDLAEKDSKIKIYNQYLEALRTGVYNYIKEDYDPVAKETLPRKYFSGGETMQYEDKVDTVREPLPADTRAQVAAVLNPDNPVVAAEVALGENPTDPNAAELAEPKAAASAVQVKPEAQRVALTPEQGAATVKFETNGTRARMYEVDDKGQRTTQGPFDETYVARTNSAAGKVFLGLVQSGEWQVKNPERGLRALIAYDARKGASEFAQSAYRALAAYQGISVDMADGVTTSPDAAFMSDEYDFVIQITASHNPENDNGIKIFTGGIVVQDRIAALINAEANSAEGRAGFYTVPYEADKVTFVSAFQKSSDRKLNAFGDLLALAKNYQQANPQAKLYADMMGGAAVPYAPQLEELGITVFSKEAMSARQYVNRKGGLYAPNPTQAENYGPEFDEFKSNAPDGSVWFGLDGDVDRLVVWVKNQGQAVEVNPNSLGMLYADNLIPKLKERAAREGKTLVVVKTLPTSLGMDLVAAKYGVELFTTPVGSKNFRSLLENPNYIVVVATEESGHQVLTINGETFFDDAVTQLYQVMTMMGETQKNPAQLSAELRTELNFDLTFNNDAVKLNEQIVGTFLGKMAENPQEIVTQVESAVGQKAEKVLVVAQDNSVQPFTPEMKLKPEQGLYFLFKDSGLGAWAWVYFRKSGTEPIIRIYRESQKNNDTLLDIGKSVIGAPSSAALASKVDTFDEVTNVELTLSNVLESIGSNAARIYDMLEDFEKPGVEVSDQFKQLVYQWQDILSFLQREAVASALKEEELLRIQQKIVEIRNAIERSFHVWIRQGNLKALKDWKFTNSQDYKGSVMYHVVPTAVWEAQRNGDYYRAPRFAADGFIHFSADVDTALAAANRFYAQSEGGVVVLKVNAQATTGGGRLAIDNGQTQYPHLYGAMPTNAVEEVIVLSRNQQGVLEMPSEMLERERQAANSKPLGGINLDPKLFDLQIKRDGQGTPFPIYDQPVENMKIDGFVPVIIKITPFDITPLLGNAADISKDTQQKLSFNR